nr:MAG TPA: hypothetical protein [Caudoviricetes sp.]
MKIQQALEIANDCGLETVGEAILNIVIHAPNLFSYYDVDKELNELKSTWNWIKEHRRTSDGKDRINENTKVKLMLDYHIADDLTDYEIYQQALRTPSFARKLGNE